MILEHVAAMLFFSGPLFYVGLWMAVGPVGIATLPELCVGILRSAMQRVAGMPGPSVVPRKLRFPPESEKLCAVLAWLSCYSLLRSEG